MEGLNNLKINTEYNQEVSNLMELFRSSLTALVPVFQKTDLKWDMLENHDEFFTLSESLFKMIVVSKFEAIAESKNTECKPFSNYGYYHKSMQDLNFIEVTSEEAPNAILVFNFISSKDKPFDTIYCNRIDKNNNVLDKDIAISYDSASFSFKFR